MITIITFLAFTGLFIGFWVLKNNLSKSIIEAADERSTFGRMFRSVENNTDTIFVSLCPNATNVQSCPDADKKVIFEGKVPGEFWFELAFLLEKGAKCSGITRRLDTYYFSDRRWGVPDDSCGNRLQTFVDGKWDCGRTW